MQLYFYCKPIMPIFYFFPPVSLSMLPISKTYRSLLAEEQQISLQSSISTVQFNQELLLLPIMNGILLSSCKILTLYSKKNTSISVLIFITCNEADNGKENPPTAMENDISCWHSISKHSPTQNTHFS